VSLADIFALVNNYSNIKSIFQKEEENPTIFQW